MTRESYLAAARREIERAARREGEYQGACSECDFHRLALLGSYCVHPAVEVASFNADPGYDAGRTVECQYQRQSGRGLYGAVVCGPDGALFKPKRGFFDRLFGRERGQ